MDKFSWDEGLSGFGLRERNGKRTYVVQYRVGHRQRRLKIGDAAKLTMAQARDKARKILAKVELGLDPAGEKEGARRDAKFTLKSVAADYLAAVGDGIRPRTYTEIHRYLNQHWSPLHATPISALARRDIATEVARMKTKNGATAAHQALAALSGLCRWAVGAGIIESNPVIGVNRPGVPKPRERVLSGEELAAIWRTAEGRYGAILKLLIATGCRKTEIGDLHRCEVDVDSRTINIPAERMKAGWPHSVWLPDYAWTVLASAMLAGDGDYIFGRDGRTGYGGWARSKAALDERLGQSIMGPWTVHDIRRTVASGMGDIGVQPHIVECVLAHRSGFRAGVGGTYNRSPYQDGVRAALLLWSSHVQALVEGGECKVVPLRA
jgi:integrase